MNQFLSWTWLLVFLLGSTVLGGCTSSRPPEERREAQAKALGTWQYRVTGTPVLDRGTFRVERQGERLIVKIRDTRRGPLQGRVRVRDDRMTMRLDQMVVSGQVEDDRFRASVDVATWDVRDNMRTRSPSRTSYQLRGTLFAERTGGPRDRPAPSHGCDPLLYESTYACPPLPPS